MSGRSAIGRISRSREFPAMQNKIENLYDNYDSQSTTTNLLKASEIIEQNANVQRQLVDSLHDISAEAPSRSSRRTVHHYVPQCSIRPHCVSYATVYPSCSSAAALIAANAASDLACTLAKKNEELCDLSHHYEKEVTNLETELSNAKLSNDDLKKELDQTKDKLELEKQKAEAISTESKSDLEQLKAKLGEAEAKLSDLEPKAEASVELEKAIAALKDEIKEVKAKNAELADHNALQAKIIKSRPVSPVTIIHCTRDRSPSPCYVSCHTPSYTTTTITSRSRPVSPVRAVTTTTTIRSTLSPNNCTQVIRQNSLVSRFDDLYRVNRLRAMDILKTYNDDQENNQKIVFSAVQEAFSVAKRAFLDWKLRVRASLSVTHCCDTLEEAVQSFINRNVDLYDLPYLTSEVVYGLERNPKISLPCCVTYVCISSFIREACRIAWEMSALAYPLDTALAFDGEVFDETKYRRSYDSEFSAPLVRHYVWPCLRQGLDVLAKGVAYTRRSPAFAYKKTLTTTTTTTTHSHLKSCIRTRSPSTHIIRRTRSCYFK